MSLPRFSVRNPVAVNLLMVALLLGGIVAALSLVREFFPRMETEQVFVTGLAADARKLELARRFGADATIDVDDEDPVRRIRELTDGRGVDVVVDVSSYATAPIVQAIDMVRPGGTIVLAGVKGFKPVPDLVSDNIVMKEIQVRGAIGVTSSGYRSAIRMLEARSTPLVEMHTHRFDLRDAELAIQTLAREVEGDESIHSCLIPEA